MTAARMSIVLTEFARPRLFPRQLRGNTIQQCMPAQLEQHLNAMPPLRVIEGFAPFCKLHVHRNWTSTRCLAVPITDGNRHRLRSDCEARTSDELPVLVRWFDGIEPPAANCLVVVLYSREQLAKGGRAITADWGAVGCRYAIEPEDTPMAPTTMLRNVLVVAAGGSGVMLERAAYCRSVEFWRTHANWRGWRGTIGQVPLGLDSLLRNRGVSTNGNRNRPGAIHSAAALCTLGCRDPPSAGNPMTPIDVAFVLLGLMLLTGLLARRSNVPAPIIFSVVGFVGGAAWHLVPALPPVSMPPDLVLFAFLPPLLTTAAYALPLKAFRRNLLPIGLLAIGLVLLTTGIAAVVGHSLVGLSWAAAFVLGAIIAPPDPVAATAVAGKTGLAHRLVVILEGEGLVNDAVAILAYGLALEAVRTGEFTWGNALWSLLRETPTGVLVGLAVGWGAAFVRQRTDSVPLEIGISLATPYLAYHVAERLASSGVLAVVTLGFMLRASSTQVSSPVARLAARTVWSFLRYASTALVFLLLGLLMGEIVVALPSWDVVRAGLILAGAVVAIRVAWMMTMPRLVAALGWMGETKSTAAEQFVLGWSGMRGVVSLALALALPLSLGGDDQTRHTIIFMTLIVIVATLIVQGATLLPIVRWLKAGDPQRERREEDEARRLAGQAGVESIHALRPRSDHARAYDADLSQRLAAGTVGIGGSGTRGGNVRERRALLNALRAQRKVVDDLRDAGRMGSALAERLDTELDLDAMAALGDGKHLTDAGDDE